MKRKVKIVSLCILLYLMIIIPKSNAGFVLTSKPKVSGTQIFVNINISDSYKLCQNMKNTGESLYGTGTNVQPHLATNSDWGAVSYLSNSIYGTNTQGKNSGIQVTINGINYSSTNGNTSGVMNWGSTRTFTSGIIKNYMNLSDSTTSSAHDNIVEIENAARSNSPYVEVVSDFRSPGMGLLETSFSFRRFTE